MCVISQQRYIYYHTLQSSTTYSTDAATLAKQPNDEWLDSGPADRRIFRERGKRGLSRIFLFWERLLVFLLPRKLVRAVGDVGHQTTFLLCVQQQSIHPSLKSPWGLHVWALRGHCHCFPGWGTRSNTCVCVYGKEKRAGVHTVPT